MEIKQKKYSAGRRPLTADCKAFSIIELLIVIVFLTTIVSGIIPLFAKAISTNKASKNKLYAYQAANAEIENMRNTSFSSLSDHTFSIPGVYNAQGTVTLTDVIDGFPQTGILKATVMVTWPYKNKTENITLVTYIAEKGINQ